MGYESRVTANWYEKIPCAALIAAWNDMVAIPSKSRPKCGQLVIGKLVWRSMKVKVLEPQNESPSLFPQTVLILSKGYAITLV